MINRSNASEIRNRFDNPKKKRVFERDDAPKVDTYSCVSFHHGYIVKLHTRSKQVFYTDRDGLWMRSRNAMRSMSEQKCRTLVEAYQKEDYENRRTLQF